MTGWETRMDNLGAMEPAVLKVRPVPSAETLSEMAKASQLRQLEDLLAALSAHPEMAARIFAAMKRTP